MQITTQCCEGRFVIRLSGSMRGREVAQLTHVVRETRHSLVVVDLKELTFIDSCGIGGLIYSSQLLKTQTRQLVLTSPPDFVKDILDNFIAADLIEVEPLSSPA